MTEKDYNPNQKENKAMKKQETSEAPVQKSAKTPEDKTLQEEKSDNNKNQSSKPASNQTKKSEPKKQPKIKKDNAVVNATSVPVSTKYAISICKFVKHKKIDTAIQDLEQVLTFKKAVPMRGEIPHRKGKIMSGRFPQKATNHFIILLKSLKANANNNLLEDPTITEAVANFASRPLGRFGSIKRKRTHIRLVAKDKIKKLKKQNKK